MKAIKENKEEILHLKDTIQEKEDENQKLMKEIE